MPEPSTNIWMRCSACRKDILHEAIHWVCSVSTCNRSRTRLVFCSVACWDSHLSTLRHREAWAVEERAPSRAAWAALADVAPEAAKAAPAPVAPAPAASRIVSPPAARAPAMSTPAARAPAEVPTLTDAFEREIIVVVSKMKKYIKDRSGMSTSDAVAEVLSDHVRALCDDSIRAAATDGRRTVLDRDVPRPRR
ncbi:MAG TPA: hypothetical protein VFH68_21470 [Polyangia bacterium]|jgi:hypothetical protein|nr:hypothetical protein [Polyangia bacterium]